MPSQPTDPSAEIVESGRIEVAAGDLATVLESAKPHPLKKKPPPIVVSIAPHDEPETVAVTVCGKKATKCHPLAAKGEWLSDVQFDGIPLYRLALSWPPGTILVLSATPVSLIVRTGRSSFRISRTDQGGAKPFVLKLPKSSGKRPEEPPPEPKGKRVELADTWDFSARVPMPQHRIPTDG